jgi:Icc-related predicted phosphoesterase
MSIATNSFSKKLIIQYLSDIHIEFFPYKFIPNTQADCLVLAGDIINQNHKPENQKNFESFFNDIKTWGKPAFYVLGNHEYYYSSFAETNNYFKNLQVKVPNLIVLNNASFKLNGVKFIGTTLWSHIKSNQEWYISRYMNDYHLIKGFTVKQSLQEHLKAKEFLINELSENCPKVVITHHLPSYKSVDKKYENSPLNSAFTTDLEYIIKTYSPFAWIHGHSHSSCDYKIENTQIVSNTRGYYRNNKIENDKFNDLATIEVNYEEKNYYENNTETKKKLKIEEDL